jgi:acetyltransferase-like isoleucine patch superfamily enzyme
MIFGSLIEKYKIRRNPAKYWRSKGVIIGEMCEIYASASFGSEPYLITLGNHVRINAGVNFVTHDGGVWVLRELYEELKDIDMFGKIHVGNNVHIGTNALIMPGVTIGNNCIIGCGAIVTKDVPDNSIAVGVPARVIESVEEYKEKHLKDFERTKMLSRAEKEVYLKAKWGKQ